MPTLTLEHLRRQAVHVTTQAPRTLARAIAQIEFIQSDPIRSPARAQDLILRHRVADYRAGDLERRYSSLAVEEDFLYAYGFVPRRVRKLLYPRFDRNRPGSPFVPTGLAADVLAFVSERGPTHPAVLATQFGRERAINGWGGFSTASTRVLQQLHYHGLLRVQRRERGVRIYEAAPADEESIDPARRLRELILLVTRVLAPVPEATLRAVFSRFAHIAPQSRSRIGAIEQLLTAGRLEAGVVDGVKYFWPADGLARLTDAPREVRFLAPFDPIVWDRRRFEHLWGWAYRFEAYVPERNRRRGYYAMPLLWMDRVIGWVNCTGTDERLQVRPGFVAGKPRERDFRQAFDNEVARMEQFLSPVRKGPRLSAF
ncbi:MAG: YcaQ family DNA glycosylase [Hyphomicrobiales bacterium]|nr:YcaQ family DNA glycosylase [Hyphomicrobiales bacterium]MBV8823867.1 YcaQ family DNA glycosylase [Hyphomicrobiales bacterium]